MYNIFEIMVFGLIVLARLAITFSIIFVVFAIVQLIIYQLFGFSIYNFIKKFLYKILELEGEQEKWFN